MQSELSVISTQTVTQPARREGKSLSQNLITQRPFLIHRTHGKHKNPSLNNTYKTNINYLHYSSYLIISSMKSLLLDTTTR